MQRWKESVPSPLLRRLDALGARIAEEHASQTHHMSIDAVSLMRAAGLEPDEWQRQLCTSTARQELLLAHRQSGKSVTVAAIALEAACKKSDELILLLSRTLKQSGELFRKVKRFYNATKPLPLYRSTELSLELENHSRIISLPGTADTVVGYSAPAVVAIDEAARVPDTLYHAIRPMLAMSSGRLIVLSSAWGKRGWFYEAYEGEGINDAAMLDLETVQALLSDLGITVQAEDLEKDTEDFSWRRTKVTAADNARLPRRFLANERRTVPDLIFRSEWMCEFLESQDAVFRFEDLERMVSDDVSPLFDDAPAYSWLSEGMMPLFEDSMPEEVAVLE